MVDLNLDKVGLIRSNTREISIISPSEITNYKFDKIAITPIDEKIALSIKAQLLSYGISEDKIELFALSKDICDNIKYTYDEQLDPRVSWLRNFALYVKEQEIEGNTAECGVLHGAFSYYINKYFNKKHYLFDTFEGFDKSDLETEFNLGDKAFCEGMFGQKTDMFNANNAERVLNAMLYLEKCVIKKGYFPDTAQGVDDKFCFVNLDMDLYAPQLAGLRFFWNKMSLGGVILLHDYFHPELPGVKKAVEDFEKEMSLTLCKIPIGDFCSVAVVKN